MSKENNSILEQLAGLVDNESKQYTFTAKALVGGKEKSGTFVAKYLGVASRLRIGTLRAKLLDGAPSVSVDVLTDDIAYMMAYLQVALIKTPNWWNFDDLDEIEDLREIYMEVYKFMQNFRHLNEESTNDDNSRATADAEVVESK